MSFMIVNTGRAASRAFYLNLRLQQGLVTCSRTQFDVAVTRFIRWGNRAPLDLLTQTLRVSSAVSSSSPNLGIVFHGARPRLAYPFDTDRNRSLLSMVRDNLGVTNVFLPVRNPEDVFLSEINRQLAKAEGDWTFPSDLLCWKNVFTPENIAALKSVAFPEWPERRIHRQKNLESLARDVAIRTGKQFSMYQLFKAVFPNIYLIPYERFLHSPYEIFDKIGKISGFRFTDHSLIEPKLNSLSNRLLVYNPFTLALPRLPNYQHHRWPGRFRRLPRQKEYRVRFRFEITSAVELCDDWGAYLSVNMDCSSLLPEVVKDLDAPISLGVNAKDFAELPQTYRSLVRNPSFVEELVGTIAPVFRWNYEYTKSRYRELYLDELPPEAVRAFREANSDEHQQMLDKLTGGTSDVL